MSETFDTEAILEDILKVLHSHGLPVQTVALNISMLDDDFEATVPHLITYKGGIFYHPKVINGVPMLFEAKRRISFDELVQRLEQRIFTPMQQFAEVIQHEFPQYTTQFTAIRQQTQQDVDFYALQIETRLTEDRHKDYNVLLSVVSLRLRDFAQYPKISAFIGWLVDEESGDDWGLDIVYQTYPPDQLEAQWHHVELIERGLPSQFQAFRKALHERPSHPPAAGSGRINVID